MNTHASEESSSADYDAHSQRSESYSGRSPEEIETEIERTREELERTLDELQSRLSPHERLHAAANSARHFGQRLTSSAAAALTPGITTMIRLDHTHVLALFRRFRPWTSARRKQALVANACLALEVHALLEEKIFYPALREAAADSEVLDKSVPEHNEMRRLIVELRTTGIGDPGFDGTFQALMRTVLHHVADEEAVVLPLAERCMADRLGPLGVEMMIHRMKLLRPNIGEAAVTTARSFPILTAAAAVGLLALGWMLLRQREQ
jgi:hemerythrin superfamily protein